MTMKTEATRGISTLTARARSGRTTFLAGRLLMVALVVAGQLSAVVAPDPSDLRDKQFRLADLDIERSFLTPARIGLQPKAPSCPFRTIGRHGPPRWDATTEPSRARMSGSISNPACWAERVFRNRGRASPTGD